MGGKEIDSDESAPWASSETVHVVLFDDDPTFGTLMERIAEQYRIRLTFCSNLDEFTRVMEWKQDRADVLILDYDLGDQTGVEMARRLPASLAERPVILVSHGQSVEVPISSWPGCIKGFLQKGIGPFAILEAALAAHDARPAAPG
jgi:DNA-binding response OmpR family regulator